MYSLVGMVNAFSFQQSTINLRAWINKYASVSGWIIRRVFFWWTRSTFSPKWVWSYEARCRARLSESPLHIGILVVGKKAIGCELTKLSQLALCHLNQRPKTKVAQCASKGSNSLFHKLSLKCTKTPIKLITYLHLKITPVFAPNWLSCVFLFVRLCVIELRYIT